VRSTSSLALAALVGCAAGRAPSPSGAQPLIDYAVTPPGPGSWTVQVEARVERAPGDRLVAPEAGGAVTGVVQVDRGSRVPLVRAGEGWLAPDCRKRCTVRYEVDLGALATECHGMECARRVGDAVLGSAATWMLRPQPTGDARIHVSLQGPNASRLATGLRPDPAGGYALRAWELGEAPFTAVGDFRRARVVAGKTPVDLVLLGAPLTMGDEGIRRWVGDAAACVAGLFGRFPVAPTIFIVPVSRADEVVFGRVLSLAGASVALLVGTETRPAQLHDDWVSVHELFHLGTPSFVGEGHWLEEGLATYYEPILRERAGWMREEDLWAHFAKEMPRGLRKPGSAASLEERDDIDSTYWGGALFALLADVRIREATHGARSLDTALRAALDQLGDATHAATVAEFLRVGDAATGTHVLSDLYAHDAMAGEPVDLDALWRSLGVEPRPNATVALRDDAPEANLRKAMAAPAAPESCCAETEPMYR
jgi:predicted metalloprotease with PDZ domain